MCIKSNKMYIVMES